jgi:hypothetical protein
VETVIDRMKIVMNLRGWSEREWARRAGLKEESNVNKIITRMASDPTRLAGDIDTFAKLARAAKVSLDWLALGTGNPVADAMTFDDGKYPTRSRVALAAFLMGFPRTAIEAVLARDDLDVDPGWEYWLRLLQLKQAELAAAAPASPLKLGQ